MISAALIGWTTVNEAQRRVSLDLRSAWSVVDDRLVHIRLALELLARGRRVAEAYAAADPAASQREFEEIRQQVGLDYIGLTDVRGRVILRGRTPFHKGDDLSADPCIARALRGEMLKGLCLLARDRLGREGESLQERAFVAFERTLKAKPRAQQSESSGMALQAAAPVRDDEGTVVGALYAGVLLNRNFDLVDRIRSIVFEDELYKGQHLGTVTIFQSDVRVATDVPTLDGGRAIGTRVKRRGQRQGARAGAELVRPRFRRERLVH